MPLVLKSFIQVSPDSHFPLQNIPFGVFKPKPDDRPRVCTAIGNFILDLSELERAGLLKTKSVFNKSSLNAFMSLGKESCSDIRLQIQKLLSLENSTLKDNIELRKKSFYELKDAWLCLPVEIGDYTDFYSSKYHAYNVGVMFRGKENALMPNWVHLPVGYHGRASSIVVSGTNIIRPRGQIKSADNPNPFFSKTMQLDMELEMGFFMGTGNKLGESIPVSTALNSIFGMTLVNDWSARDIQSWEYVPLGPFLSKNFATSISPWIVMLDALEPFKIEGEVQEPEPLEYLRIKNFTYNIELEVYLQTEKNPEPVKISHSNFKYLYWNIAQQLAHHTVSGCNMKTGDLLASGTISGPEKSTRGCMLELTWRGAEPLQLPGGETRDFFEDGDIVTITGYCQGDGYKIGFGEVKGKILPAK
jgi:fumarylacetoacetase